MYVLLLQTAREASRNFLTIGLEKRDAQCNFEKTKRDVKTGFSGYFETSSNLKTGCKNGILANEARHDFF